MIEKKGSAKWSGGLKDGKGSVSTETGVLDNEHYSFAKRFENEPGTNPEELLAAAHAACFSMALSNVLGSAGMTAESIETVATVTLDASVPAITKVHLDLTASVTGGDEAAFLEAANGAKEGCPVSKLFNADITLDAKLV